MSSDGRLDEKDGDDEDGNKVKRRDDQDVVPSFVPDTADRRNHRAGMDMIASKLEDKSTTHTGVCQENVQVSSQDGEEEEKCEIEPLATSSEPTMSLNGMTGGLNGRIASNEAPSTEQESHSRPTIPPIPPQPGAYRVDGIDGNVDDELSTIESHARPGDDLSSTDEQPSTSKLVTAWKVQDRRESDVEAQVQERLTEFMRDAPVAEIQEPGVTQEESRAKKKRRTIIGAVSFVLILAAIGATLAIVLPNNTEEPSSTIPTEEPALTIPKEDSPLVKQARNASRAISGDVIDDVGSPQFAAFEWAVEDALGTLSPGREVLSERQLEDFEARYVMAVLYYSMGGENWQQSRNFLSKNHICLWGARDGVICAGNQSVSSLLLSGNNLRGTIPQEIAYLRTITKVDFGRNDLKGTLPAPLFSLPLLWKVTLSRNSLSGQIPISVRDANVLTYLLLENNKLTGNIPASLGRSTTLRTLDLGFNQFTGNIPEFSHESQLEELSLDYNNFGIVGTIPGSIQRLSNLTLLSLGNNSFTGSIPEFLGTLPNLRVLYLFDNELTGLLPDFLFNSPQPEDIRISDNRLSGTIPQTIGSSSVPSNNLRYLDIDRNLLTGTIPSTIGQFTQLTDLRFQDNRLSGPIPTQIGELAALSGKLLLNLNRFNGTIPTEIGRLTNLRTELRLNNNELTGPLPSEIGNLANLGNLILQNNMLDGDIPPEIGNCQGLVNLYLGNNTFTGAPSELRSLPNLKIFYIPDNLIAGPVPIMQSSKLIEVQIQRNNFTGDIGTFIDALPPSVATIDTDNNDLSGQLPLSIGKFTDLSFFDVQSNAIDGTIPEAMGDLSKLSTLNLGYNSFSSTIPVSVQSLPFLNTVFLDGNQFTGNIDGFCDKSFELFSAVTCSAPTNTLQCSCCTHCCFTEGDALRCNELSE